MKEWKQQIVPAEVKSQFKQKILLIPSQTTKETLPFNSILTMQFNPYSPNIWDEKALVQP